MKFYVYENKGEIIITPEKLAETKLKYIGYIGEYNSYYNADKAVWRYGYINLIKEEV